MKEILDAIERQNVAFGEFKRANDARLERIEKGDPARAAELNEQMKKAFETMTEQKRLIEQLEAKLTNRISTGGKELSAKEQADEDHRKGWNEWVRKGNDAGLKDLEAKNAMNIATSADGGYALPKVIDTSIDAIVVNISPIRQLAQVVPITTPDFHKLVNVRGTSSGWVAENAARSATNTPQFADVVPPMGEIYANPQVSGQALDDMFFDVEAWLAGEVATEFAFQEGAAFCVGDGTNKPKGLTAYTTAATADGSRAFGTIEHVATGVSGGWPASNPGDVLITLVSKLKAAYRQGSVFITNKAALFEIAAFKDTGGRYIFNPIAAPGVPNTVLNYPVYEAEDMPAKGASSLTVAFGNFKRAYLVVDRMGTRVLRDPFTNKPYVGFYTTRRVGGGVINSEAYKLLKFV